MKKLIIPLLSVGLAVGCGDVPTSTAGHTGADELTPNRVVAGNSGCYAVSGTIDQFATPTGFAGTISGDVVGLNEVVAGPVVVKGKSVHRSVEQTWRITGGIVDPLIGQTVRLEGSFVGTLAHLPQIGVSTKLRVVEGAQKANLTIHGTTDVSTVPPSSHLSYNGVICP